MNVSLHLWHWNHGNRRGWNVQSQKPMSRKTSDGVIAWTSAWYKGLHAGRCILNGIPGCRSSEQGKWNGKKGKKIKDVIVCWLLTTGSRCSVLPGTYNGALWDALRTVLEYRGGRILPWALIPSFFRRSPKAEVRDAMSYAVSCIRGDVCLYWASWWLSGKESPCQCRGHRFHPWVRKIPWRRKWQSTPVFLPGKSHGQRNLGRLQSTGSQKSPTWPHNWKLVALVTWVWNHSEPVWNWSLWHKGWKG